MPIQPNESASTRLSTVIIESGKTPDESAAIKAHLDTITKPSSPIAQVEQSIQALGAHIRGLTPHQRDEIKSLYLQAQSDFLRSIEDGQTIDNSARFRLRTGRLMMESAGLIEAPQRDMKPGIPVAPPVSKTPIITTASHLIKGGDDVAVVTGPGNSIPQGSPSRRYI